MLEQVSQDLDGSPKIGGGGIACQGGCRCFSTWEQRRTGRGCCSQLQLPVKGRGPHLPCAEASCGLACLPPAQSRGRPDTCTRGPPAARGVQGEVTPLYVPCESRKLTYSPEGGISFQGRGMPLAAWAYLWPPHGSCLVGADLEVTQQQPTLEMTCSRVPGPSQSGRWQDATEARTGDAHGRHLAGGDTGFPSVRHTGWP